MFHFQFWSGGGRASRFSFQLILAAVFTHILCLSITGICEGQTANTVEERQLEDLTKTLVSLSAQYAKATPLEQIQLLPQLEEITSTRFQQLATMAPIDPRIVLRVALPDAIRALLPSQLQEKIETAALLEGTVEVLYEDNEAMEHEDDQLRYFLHVGDKRFALSFVAKPRQHLQTGTFVRVSGIQIADSIVLESETADLELLGASLAAVTGTQRVLVVLVNFSNAPAEPYTAADARKIIFQDVNNFYLENSFNKVGLSGDVYGWYTLPLTSSACDAFGIRDAANAAAAAHGADLSSYAHFIYAFPQNACGFSGSGTIGGNPTYMWINGDPAAKVIAHEFGHNLGLYHSHAWECGATSLGGDCTSLEYGDTFDVMGDTDGLAHFNAFQKEQLGWLASDGDASIVTIETGGVYLLSPYESSGGNPKALKVLKSVDPTTGKKTWYYIERRWALGFDSWLSGNTNIQNGVLIHTGTESSGNSSYLIDMTPGDTVWWQDWDDPALITNQSFTDSEAGITIRTLWANDTGAAVSIAFGSIAPTPAPCVRVNPSLALSPARSQWVSPGSKVIYTLQVTNNDSGSCAASTFAVQANLLSGWKVGLGSPTLTIAPGEQASVSITVTSPASIPDGLYPIEVGVTRKENVPAATTPLITSATYAISSALQMTFSSVQISYTPGQTSLAPVVGVQVLFADAPLANVKVTFSLVRPNGRTIKKTGVTGTNGVATTRFLLKGKDLSGAYQLAATGKQKKALVGSASSSFLLQ